MANNLGDRNCPHVKFEFWDAMISSEGDCICHCETRPNDPGEYGGPGDRPICYEKSYAACRWYKQSLNLVGNK